MSNRRQTQPPNPRDYINCPLDLDGIIMSPTTTPNVVELNCTLCDDNLLFDIIRLSTCAYWMFKLDVLEQFSSEFRLKLYACLPGLARTTRMYFNYQIENSPSHKELLGEYKRFLLETGLQGGDPLNNPLTMLGNNMKDSDMEVLSGKMTPRQLLLHRIQEFLKTKDKSQIDFSHSLFLPEFLNPKFFQDLSEAEHIVLLGNLTKYFGFLSKFFHKDYWVPGLRLSRSIKPRNELYPPQHIIKHVLMDERSAYTNRVKMLAWNQLNNELDRMYAQGSSSRMFNLGAIQLDFDKRYDELEQKGLHIADISNWMDSADGVFESFELDCTLHNVDATDFILHVISEKKYHNLSRGLMDFQDTDVRNKLFKTVGNAMTPFR